MPDLTNPAASLQLPSSPISILFCILQKTIHQISRLCSAATSGLVILLCFLYLKYFQKRSAILVDGYVTLLRTFAEYAAPLLCLCYGFLDMNVWHTTLGVAGVASGFGVRALLTYHATFCHDDKYPKPGACLAAAAYVALVCVCCCTVHSTSVSIGVLPCATRIFTCVLPLVALSDGFRGVGGSVGWCFSVVADAMAVGTLWWHCAHLSIRYFVVVPSVMGLLFSFVQYMLREIQKTASNSEITTYEYSKSLDSHSS